MLLLLCLLNGFQEQVQNPDKLIEYLEEVCCHPGNSRETQTIVMCWSLAHAYRALFNTIHCSKGEEGENKMTDTTAVPAPAAAPALATGTTVASALAAGTVAAQTLVTGTAVKLENQPVPISISPI